MLFLLVQSTHCIVHIDSKWHKNVDAHYNSKVVKHDKVHSIDLVTTTYINKHLNSYLPVVYNQQYEKGNNRTEQIIEVYQVVELRNTEILEDFRGVNCNFTAKEKTPYHAKKVEYDERDNEEILDRTDKVSHGLDDKSKYSDFVSERQDLYYANENDKLKKFWYLVVS